MTNIVVLIKQVPDYESDRTLTDGEFVLDRDAADAVLDEINERAVEAALQIKEAEGGEVTVLAVGPTRANEAIRRALAMGADKAVHVVDDAIRGSDVIQTSWIIAKALGTIEGAELVLAGNTSSDGNAGAVPAVVAEYLGLPQLTHVRTLEVSGGAIKAERETDAGIFALEAALPAVVSVNEKINEPRNIGVRGLMAAKKKPIETVSLADIDVEPEQVGLANAASSVTAATPKPPKQAGEKVVDEGEGGNLIAQFLVAQKII